MFFIGQKFITQCFGEMCKVVIETEKFTFISYNAKKVY